jgi:hypothetical protein
MGFGTRACAAMTSFRGCGSTGARPGVSATPAGMAARAARATRRRGRRGVCQLSPAPDMPAALVWAALCQYCCKSPKLPGANFLAVKKSDRRPPIDVAPITLPRSPASLSSGNEVPHIFTRKSRVRPKEILITSAKRLLQQNLPGPNSCTAAKNLRQLKVGRSQTNAGPGMPAYGIFPPHFN